MTWLPLLVLTVGLAYGCALLVEERAELLKAVLVQTLRAGPGSAVELMERLRREADIEIPLHRLYAALHALERESLLESWNADPSPERGGRPRRFYRLVSKRERT